MKSWIAYVPFRVAAALFGLLPEPAVRWIGQVGGRIWFNRSGDKVPLLESHMRRVLGPTASDADVDEAVRGMFRSYARYWAETFWFRPRRKDAISDGVERVNFDPIYAAQAAGRGIVFAVPHMGNWEIAGVIAHEIGSPILAVAEDLPNRHITDWFIRVREKFDIDIVLTTDPQRRSKLIRRLKGGGAIALLSDRDVTGNGIDVEFFGERTTVPAGPVALAELTDSALIPVAAYFREGKGYRIEVRDAVELPGGTSRAERVSAGAQALTVILEDMIRVEPSQWHLFQPNWPSDERLGASR
ncbi:MAG: phosphatidylinositol mannoside acyltransferase [Acidimicrobiia bacterium]|nr:MAG: phosphatidylinositol mannoside acyltransferase [Acidimicrobiia bacterium]